MKILYGVCGEGLGHAVRSAVVAEHLESRGHSVTFACGRGRAHDYLDARWPGRVVPIMGVHTKIQDNRVSPLDSLLSNLVRQLFSPMAHAGAFLSVPTPDVVISDFDAWTARYAGIMQIPLIGVDNIHFITHCNHAVPMNEQDLEAAALAYPVADAAVPNARHYLVTTIAEAPICRERTTLHLPILRPEVLGTIPIEGTHVTVYFNDRASRNKLVDVLSRVPVAFRIYGMLDAHAQPEYQDNLTFCPLSEKEFLSDLASCRCVIGGGGFTLISEAIYLHKPMLAVPFGGQFEQILNAKYLQALGYGERCDQVTEEALYHFLLRVPVYQQNLSTVTHDANVNLLASVEAAIES